MNAGVTIEVWARWCTTSDVIPAFIAGIQCDAAASLAAYWQIKLAASSVSPVPL